MLILAQYLEAMMLICFGISWPVAIAKTLRCRQVSGQSLGFLVLILIGYLAGIMAKVTQTVGNHFADSGHSQAMVPWVTWLYTLNAAMVLAQIVLYLRFRKPQQA